MTPAMDLWSVSCTCYVYCISFMVLLLLFFLYWYAFYIMYHKVIECDVIGLC